MSSELIQFKVTAPSNIALVKYWGKFGRQYPMNPSISMTLKNCVTEMSFKVDRNKKEKGITNFLFENQASPKFEKRLNDFLKSIEDLYPLGKELNLEIKSQNSFPHSAGIASSASAMAAFAAGLVHIESSLKNNIDKIDLQRVSELARIASGSACRSMIPNYAIWGETKMDIGSNEHGVSFENIHENFKSMNDSILIVSSEEKSVSSSLGHQLMHGHAFREARIEQAHENMRNMINAIATGDYDQFGEVLENDALTLHALMMTSYPSFILLKPNSLAIIEKIRILRNEHKIPMYFTIDAGPNIHLLYPDSIKDKATKFIEQDLMPFCTNVIHDRIGNGVSIINE